MSNTQKTNGKTGGKKGNGEKPESPPLIPDHEPIEGNGVVIHVIPRFSCTWKEFLEETPEQSVGLDGFVKGGPNWDPKSLHVNFDHHDGVVRDATMSTCMQVYFAIKGGLMTRLSGGNIHVYINDTDPDSSLAAWLLINHTQFEGIQNIPQITRLLEHVNRMDVTGGAFPMNLAQDIFGQYAWIFESYMKQRRSGDIAKASEDVMKSNLEAILGRLDKMLDGQAKTTTVDTSSKILFDCPHFKVIEETGGTEARQHLFANGLDAFVSIVAVREDGNTVYSIGRRSQYIDFPVEQMYKALNKTEGTTAKKGWGGSDIIGGSPRETGSTLTWEQVRDVVLEILAKEGKADAP